MDKDATIEVEEMNSSDESVEVDEISFEDLMRADEDTAKRNDAANKIYNDLIAVKKEEKEEAAQTPSPATAATKSVTVTQPSNNNVIQNKLVASTSTPSFVRIAPRSNAASTSSTTTTAVKASNGKIIYLQRPGGSSVPVRVPASMTANSSANNSTKSTVQIHVIRTPDGNLVPVKSTKGINIPNVSQLAGKKIIATTSGASSGQMLIKTPIKTISPAGSSISTSTTSSLGSALMSSVEAAKPKVRHVITAKSVLASSINGNSSGGTKMLMQSPPGGRQLMVSSQNVIKLSPTTSSGQLQAIQIPGKSGLQYVRVLNKTSGIAHKIATSDSTTTPKYTVVRQTKPPMKFMVQSPLNDKERQRMMTTVPAYRRINDVMVKSKDGSEAAFMQAHKISQINSQIRRFSVSGDAKPTTSGSKYIVVSKSSLIRSTVTSQNQKITHLRQLATESQKQEADAGRQSPPPAKKLYTVLKPTTVHKDVKEMKVKVKAEPVKPATTVAASRSSRASPPPSDDGVTIRRKHCNCTKSQCLKLYCDCFANSEFCQDCNCKDCFNNLDNEDERQKAIRICLERNPNSFKPKITAATNESDQRLHNKGCNCKRSGCLKNYCECYEAKIPCSSNCKCVGCRNVDDHPDLDMDMKKSSIPTAQTHNRSKRSFDDMIKQRHSNLPSTGSSSVPTSMSAAIAASVQATASGPLAEKQPCNFITQEVVDATIQCLIAQADECKKSSLTAYQTEKMVMEELGRCLVEIIDFSIRNTDQN